MTTLNDKFSRRKFLQMTAGAAIGAAMLNMPGMSFAAGAKVKAASYNNLPDAVTLAANSELVQLSYQKIKDAVKTIQDPSLARMTMDIVNNPVPTFMNNYQLPGSKRTVYNKLVAAGLLDSSKTSLENFMPPYNGSLPQQATMLIRAALLPIPRPTCKFPKAFTIPTPACSTAISAMTS